MGICLSKPEFDASLKRSILTKLIPDSSDWSLFSTICKCENYNLSKRLNLNKKDAFYVIINGEVNATLFNNSKAINKSKQISTYLPGDIIHMYSGSIVSSDGDLIAGDYRVSFSIKSPSEGAASILSVDIEELQDFVATRPQLKLLHKLTFLKVSDVMAELNLGSLSLQEVEMLCVLSKPLLLSQGDLLFQEGSDPKPIFGRHFPSSYSKNSDRSSFMMGSSLTKKPLLQPTMLCDMGILLCGPALSLSPQTDQNLLRHRIYQRGKASRGKGLRVSGQFEGGGGSTDFQISNPTPSSSRSFWDALRLSSVRKVHHEESPSLSFADDGTMHHPGFLFGTELLVCPDSTVGLWNVMAIDDVLIGSFPSELLPAIREICPNIYQAVLLHFKERLVREMRAVIPLIKDLSPSQQQYLSPMISLHQFKKGEVVYKQGDPGLKSFILLHGSVQESFHDDWRAPDKPFEEIPTNVLGRHQHFGEVSMVMGIPYSHTITCIEPAIALSLDSESFRTVLQTDRLRMAEMKIKLLGPDVELMHVLDHPEGYKVVVNFLRKEMASENLDFWHQVDRFEELCILLLKQYKHLFEGSSLRPSTLDGLANDVRQSVSHLPVSPAINEEEEEQTSVKGRAETISPLPLASTTSDTAWIDAMDGNHKPGEEAKPYYVPRLSIPPGNEDAPGLNLPTSSSKVRRMSSVEVKTVKGSLAELKELGDTLMEKFIREGSISQVNIPGKMRVETEDMFRDWIFSVRKVSEIEEQSMTRIPHTQPTSPQHQPSSSQLQPSITNQQNHHIPDHSISPSPSTDPSDQPGSSDPNNILMGHLTHLIHPTHPLGVASPSNVLLQPPHLLQHQKDYENPARQEVLKTALLNSRFIFRRAKKEVYELLRKDTFVRLKQTPEFSSFISGLKPYEPTAPPPAASR